MDCFGTYSTHVQTCDYVRVQSATEWTASVHALHMSKPVISFVFKVLWNGLLRYMLYTCPNQWLRSCSKCYGMDCNGLLRYIVYTCPNKWLHSRSKCNEMDCFGTYFTHVQTCDYIRVQSATEWTASVHSLHTSKPVMLHLVDFSLSFMFRITRAHCYIMCHLLLRVCVADASPCWLLFVIHVWNHTRSLLRHVSSSCMCVHGSTIQMEKYGKVPKNKNHLQKVLKSEMFEMLVFCCKFHRNLMVNENVMLKLDGKTHTKWVFPKKPRVFTSLCFF